MEEATLCDGCGRMTVTVHGRCPSCWYEKRPDLIIRAQPPHKSLGEMIWDGVTSLAWYFPGAALTLLAIFAFGDDLLLAIGLLVLLSGGALKFGDFFP